MSDDTYPTRRAARERAVRLCEAGHDARVEASGFAHRREFRVFIKHQRLNLVAYVGPADSPDQATWVKAEI